MATPQAPTPTGRVVIVTGASSGIGRVTARDLAARGDTVVMTSRGSGRGAEVADEIRTETGGEVHFLPADLAVLADQRAFVAAFRERWSRLDVLVLNAGLFMGEREETVDGIERTWALNHLGVFVPAVLLADLLVASAPARVVVTSSSAAFMGRIRWRDLELRERYQGWPAYAQSKLANMVFARELARRLEGTGVSVHVFHPGFVATAFGSTGGRWARLVATLQRWFGRTPEAGADTMTFLATDEAALRSTGVFWTDRRPRALAAAARDETVGERLWDESVARAGVTEDELVFFRDRRRASWQERPAHGAPTAAS